MFQDAGFLFTVLYCIVLYSIIFIVIDQKKSYYYCLIIKSVVVLIILFLLTKLLFISTLMNQSDYWKKQYPMDLDIN